MDSRRRADTTLTVSIPLNGGSDPLTGQLGQTVLQIDAPLDEMGDSSTGLMSSTPSTAPSIMRRTVSGGANIGTAQSQLSKPILAQSQVHCCPPEQWVPEAPVVNCMSPDCTNTFSLFNRKHRCRMCGRVFCSSCASNVVTLPASAIGVTRNGVMATGNDDGLAPISFGGSSTGASASAGGVPNGYTAPSHARLNQGRGDAPTAGSAPQLTGNLIANDTDVTALNAPVSLRICNGCFYEMQLVVCTRRDDGTRRRKSRGEFKLFQKALVVNILSFLTLRDLAETSLVSSDFYFMSRNNVIWYQYNMVRWMKDAERPHKSLVHAGYSKDQQYKKRMRKQQFEASSVIQDATALTESEAAKRVISLHARYNFTQFLDFTRRQEMARCQGMSSFSVGARVLCASPIKIAIVGPCRIGKTAAVRTFYGDNPQRLLTRPTIGFTRCTTSVRLAGGVVTEVVLHIYDISGEPRYEALRRFICRQCHAIGLCYDPLKKLTLVQAADIMMGIEPELGPQPVVVCGLIRREAVLDMERRAVATDVSAAVPSAIVSVTNRPSAGAQLPPCLRSTASLTPSEMAAASATSIDGESCQTTASPCSPSPGLGMPGQSTTASPTAASTSLPRPSRTTAGSAEDALSAPQSPSGAALPPNLSRNSLEKNVGADASPRSTSPPPLDSAVAAAPTPSATPVPAAPAVGVFEVSEQDAVDITVRGAGSLQCDVLAPSSFFQMLIQSLLGRLAEATMVPTATVAQISQEISTNRRAPRTLLESVTATSSRVSTTRTPKVSVAAAQELLNITMQPAPLDILVDR